ncbi:MAG: YdcF family protein [Anaerolineales bacterium]|nr:YdcF family protein [Anaerolineales bacterium]
MGEDSEQWTVNSLRKRRIAMIALGTLLLFLGILALLYWRVDARSQTDRARRVDAIIVLGSAVWLNERPSPSLNARIQHAIALYQAGYASNLILCGGVGANPPSEAEVMRRVATSAGVPAAALVLEDRSHSTEENLANAKILMDARGWRSAVIVSDPFHLYRAEMIARDLGIEAYGSGASASPTYTAPQMRAWYTLREVRALVWYYATRVFGEPTWLYGILKGKI